MSEVTTVKYELNVPKESKDVVDFLAALYDMIKAKKPLAEYAGLIDELFLAIDGSDKLDDELKSANKGAIIAYLVEKIGSKF